MDLTGILRKFVENGLSAATRALRMTGIESLAIASVEDERTELARAGRRFWGGNQIIANGIAPVQAIPTTTATLALVNKEKPGGASMLVDRANFWLGSGTAAAGATLLAAVCEVAEANVPTTQETGYEVGSSSAGKPASKALFKAALTVVDPVWVGLFSNFQLAAANVGQGDGWIESKGGILVPPRYALGLAVLSGAGTTPLYGISLGWSELVLDLE